MLSGEQNEVGVRKGRGKRGLEEGRGEEEEGRSGGEGGQKRETEKHVGERGLGDAVVGKTLDPQS